MDAKLYFDSGSLSLGNTLFTKETNIETLTTNEIVLYRRLKLPNGWEHCVTKECQFYEHIARFSFSFFENKLQRIVISLEGNTLLNESYSREMLDRCFREQNVFLREKLGDPTLEKDRLMVYEFDWGKIESIIDVKGWSSSIILSWFSDNPTRNP